MRRWSIQGKFMAETKSRVQSKLGASYKRVTTNPAWVLTA
jgi:hypothetical protein